MLSYWQIFIVLVSTVIVGVADMLIKKVASVHSFAMAIRNPWVIVAFLLYLIQVAMIVYIFVRKGDLVIYGNIFIIFYAITTALLGLLVFKERLSITQIIGIVLAVVGAILINRK
jgi:drug/metabolite transporter (DMT)-like permease